MYLWERRFVEGIHLEIIERVIVPLFIAFVLLNFADTLTTLIALRTGFPFVELNPYASLLFRMQFPGFFYAYLFKLIPAVPLFYLTFLKNGEKYRLEVRLLKFVAFVVLVAADIYLGFIVLGSNLPKLISAGLV